ncbi:MotA/TolQ/ExbB proton channel family protein [bacterium]|nr:MotA/TolQ/ExbB proton channel family protein [bacterium]
MAYLIILIAIFGAIVFGVSVSAAGTSGLLLLFDLPGLIFVLVPSLLFSINVSSWKTFTLGWTLTFSNSVTASKEEVREVRAMCTAFGNITILMGVMGMLIGLILMLADLSNPDAIAPNMAVATLPPLYGILFKLFSYAAERKLDNRLTTTG